MFRFRLKTLLVFAMVVALAAMAWTMIPQSVWSYVPRYIRLERGNIVALNDPVEFGAMLPNGDLISWDPPYRIYNKQLFVSLWIIGLLGIAYATALVIVIVILRDDFVEYQRANHFKRQPMKIFIEPGYLLDSSAPTLTAGEVVDDDIVRFRVWCLHCLVWHCHGPRNGHREAHCHESSSPFDRSDYNLECSDETKSVGRKRQIRPGK